MRPSKQLTAHGNSVASPASTTGSGSHCGSARLGSYNEAEDEKSRGPRALVVKAIIVGGGIGGLVTALMLHARGIDCELFEQSDGIRELGVGINTLPHAIKELQQLGLLHTLDGVV